MRYKYLCDPIFLVACAAYLANRAVVSRLTPDGWCACYLNDVLCVPVVVPFTLFVNRKVLGLRSHDYAPSSVEVFVCVVVWSLLFEVVFPLVTIPGRPTFADPWDIAAYFFGAGLSMICWKRYYGADHGVATTVNVPDFSWEIIERPSGPRSLTQDESVAEEHGTPGRAR